MTGQVRVSRRGIEVDTKVYAIHSLWETESTPFSSHRRFWSFSVKCPDRICCSIRRIAARRVMNRARDSKHVPSVPSMKFCLSIIFESAISLPLANVS